MTVWSCRTTKTLPSPVATSSCASRESPLRRSSAAASNSAAACAKAEPSGSVEALTLPSPSKTTAALICDEISVRSSRALWASMRRSLGSGRMRVRRRDLWGKFFADRGTHLAAMIAYFALLSFVPLTFLSLSVLGLTGRADESSFLVKEIKHTLPGTPIDRIIDPVHTVQDNAAALGLVGGAALLWTSLSLFSVLESAFNIVYARPNRSFLHGKGLASVLMVGSLVTLFIALLAGSLGVSALQEYAPGFVGNPAVAYTLSIFVSLLGVFAFLVSCYYVLTNDDVTVRDVLPGALLATVFLEGTFQTLPLYQRYADLNPALGAFGAPAILLVWLYVMSNVIVFGAELNWWRSRRREQQLVEELPGLA